MKIKKGIMVTGIIGTLIAIIYTVYLAFIKKDEKEPEKLKTNDGLRLTSKTSPEPVNIGIEKNRIPNTWDKVSNKRLLELHPFIRGTAIDFINEMDEKYNIKLRAVETFRPPERQQKLYNKGRDKNGRIVDKKKIVTKAKPWESIHQYRLAIDVVEIKNGEALWDNPNWSLIGDVGKSYGFVWGGDWKFKDNPHFEKSFGLHHSQLRELYASGQRDGEFVKLV